MTEKTNFKARLTAHPEVEVEDEKTKEKSKQPLGVFTVGKSYRIFAVFDNGQGYTDFLCADNEGIFRWINMSIFRSK